MASNAASSVQFRVNGTETARDGHAKLNARGARTLALGGWTLESYLTHIVLTTEPPGRLMTTAPDAEYQIPGNLCVVGLDDVGGFGTGANLSTAPFSRIFDARYNPSLERVAFVHQHQHFPNRHFRLWISPPDRPIAVTRTSCEMPKILAFGLHSDSSC